MSARLPEGSGVTGERIVEQANVRPVVPLDDVPRPIGVRVAVVPRRPTSDQMRKFVLFDPEA